MSTGQALQTAPSRVPVATVAADDVPPGVTMQHPPELPVRVQLPQRLADEVVAFVESEAGWHVVDGDGPLVPALTLASAPVAGTPHAVVVAGAAPAVDVRAALLAGALDVISWPDERANLLALPQRLRADTPTREPTPTLLVGATRGGVGASTVALGVAGTVAWSGGTALVVGGADAVRLAGLGTWSGPGAAELTALGAQSADEVAGVARPVPGVPGLFALKGPATLAAPAGWPYDVVVVDGGVVAAARAQLVVAAADGALANAPPAAPVVVVSTGPLDRAGVRRRLGRDPVGWLPHSARVARAGTAGRVPSALPGSWLKALREALAAARSGRATTTAAERSAAG